MSEDKVSTVREPADTQLEDYKKSVKNIGFITSGHGAPVDDHNNSIQGGIKGPLVLKDHILLDMLSNFDRERIPERVVHAKGGGAFGYFEVTHDITKYCKADVFSKIGKRTPIAIRFSTVSGESGTSDTVRDPRGFAIKFYTEQGIWDLVGLNSPVFFIRDPMLFPSFVHSQKRNPVTHLFDANMYWDFLTLRPESLHQVVMMFSDRGLPNGFRYMHGFGLHAFKMINADGEQCFVKFHYKSDQGLQNLDVQKAHELVADDPDYSIRDLYNAIAKSNYPSWILYIQVMTFKELPVNCPFRSKVSNYQRDGPQAYENQGSAPNYYPNSFSGPEQQPKYSMSRFSVSGDVAKYDSSNIDNYSQAGVFYRNVLSKDEQNRLVNNLASSIKHAADFIQERAVSEFSKVDVDLGKKLKEKLQAMKSS